MMNIWTLVLWSCIKGWVPTSLRGISWMATRIKRIPVIMLTISRRRIIIIKLWNSHSARYFLCNRIKWLYQVGSSAGRNLRTESVHPRLIWIIKHNKNNLMTLKCLQGINQWALLNQYRSLRLSQSRELLPSSNKVVILMN